MQAVTEELRWWLDLLAEAERLAQDMPPPICRQVEAHGGRHELARFAMQSALLSTETRADIRATLTRAVMLLREVEVRRAGARPDLRAVESPGAAHRN